MPPRGPSISYPMVFPVEAVSFDIDAFDEMLRNQGVQLVHWRSMRCPVGMTDPDDVMRRPHDHHQNCSNGFIYTKAGIVTVGFQGNSTDVTLKDYGAYDGSTVQVTLPRFYDDKPTTPVQVCAFDRMYPLDEAITVDNWQTIAAHASGVDRLQFPATAVSDVMDAHGKRYAEGVDFTLVNGQIKWTNGVGPGMDPKTGKGVVVSVRYSYRPFWYVKRMLHDTRIAQTEDGFGNRAVTRMPQGAQLQREFHFEKAQADEQAAADAEAKRQGPGPSNGSFGPR